MRQCFRLLLSLFVTFIGQALPAGGQQTKPPAEEAADPITGIVHSGRLASGVPLGGLGTGTFQVMTDGTISRATINNNWAYPTGDLPGCFAAIWTHAGTQSIARVLALQNAYKLPAVPGLDYEGLSPQAKLTFTDSALPVTVSLRAFSPLIPHDIKNSSFPAAAFVFRLRNDTSAIVETSIALSWENTLGVGGSGAIGPFHNRTGSTVAPVPDAEGFFALKFTGPPLTSSADPEQKLRDNATGDMTLMTAPEYPQSLVTSASWDTLDARPGWWDDFAKDGSLIGTAAPGAEGKVHPAGVIAVRITLKPRETVDIPFAVSWYTPRLNTLAGGDYGHYYQNLFPDSYRAARGLLAEWHSLLSLTEEWQGDLLFSNMPRWMARRLINSTSILTTHSVFTRDESFALLDSAGGVDFTAGSALPSVPLTEQLPYLKEPPRDSVNSSAKPGSFVSLSRRITVSALLLDFYPRLDARSLRLFMAMQAKDGALPTSLGDMDSVIGVPQSGSIAAVEESLALFPGPAAPLATPDALDNTSAFVLQIAQYAFWTGDREFLHVYFPNVRQALTVLLANRDTDGLPAFTANSLKPASATLYLAALRAGGKLALMSSDQAFMQASIGGGLRGVNEILSRLRLRAEDEHLAAACEEAYARAAAGTRKRFWNGQFYAERTPGGQTVCSINQLFGQWIADQLLLVDRGKNVEGQESTALLPGTSIETALQSISARNNKAGGTQFGPFARVLENGMPVSAEAAVCDLPSSLLAVATVALSQRQPEMGVRLLRQLDDARINALRSPWQSPLQIDANTGKPAVTSYASITHGADWNTLSALEGYAIDLWSGEMTLSPNIPGNWRSIIAPIYAPTFWGRLEYRPSARGGIITFRLDRLIALPAATASRRLSGSAGLILTSIRIPGAPPRPNNAAPTDMPIAHVSLGTKPLGVRAVRQPSGDFILTFETPLKMAAGDRLEVDLH